MLVTSVGILVADIIAAGLPKVSGPGELTFTERKIEFHLGGHAANVSLNLRKLSLKRDEVSSVGAIGEDIFGKYVEAVLERQGVITHLQRVKGVGTSKDLVLVVKGQDRRYHVDVGANWYLGVDYVLSVLDEERPLVSYVGGVGLLGEFDEKLPRILQEAKKHESLTFVDPVAPYGHGWDITLPALAWTDIFHCNNYEAAMITGEENPREAAIKISKKGAKIAIVTLGREGLIAVTKKTIFKLPAFETPVIDPSGAGDAFCAGVIHGIVHAADRENLKAAELSDDEVARILLKGEAAGAACVTMVGTTTAVTKQNVERLLEEQAANVLQKLQMKRL